MYLWFTAHIHMVSLGGNASFNYWLAKEAIRATTINYNLSLCRHLFQRFLIFNICRNYFHWAQIFTYNVNVLHLLLNIIYQFTKQDSSISRLIDFKETLNNNEQSSGKYKIIEIMLDFRSEGQAF